VGPGEAKGERLLLNNSGVSSLYQLVVIGRMWYNGPGQLNFTPHTLPYCFGFQIVIRKSLGMRFVEVVHFVCRECVNLE
jgi:hypothetical protein